MLVQAHTCPSVLTDCFLHMVFKVWIYPLFLCRKAHCRLLVTHDDYSMMTKLPKEKTSVVTILRNPVDRVFSTYEFSIEVAARFLVHPNLTSATQMAGRIRKKNNVVSTLDIWPWKYLVPWMREDLFSRVWLIFLLLSTLVICQRSCCLNVYSLIFTISYL